MAKRLKGKELQDFTDRVLEALILDDIGTVDEVREALIRLADERGLVEWR